jgi:hypothetical protein
MATKPLPTIATDPQGRPVKQKDVGAGVLEAMVKSNELMLDIQKVQLDVLTDILGTMRAIGLNIVMAMKQQNMATARAEKPIEAARGETKNKLAELEKEREGKLGSVQAKPESMFDSLKKLFDDYFGIFKTVFTIIKAVLIPMVLGFVVGFRKKFDLISVAITLAILFPIRTFKLMSRVFGFLYQLLIKLWDGLKVIGNTVKNLIMRGPKLVKSLFTDISLVFLRIKDAITSSKAFTFITSIFTKIKSFFDVVLKGLQPILKFFTEGKGILSKIFGVLKPLARVLGLPLTILFGIIGGIQGALEGFEKEGLIGGLKGLISGALDGAFGWIFDAIGWVFGALGFEDAEKALEEFSLGTVISNFLENFIIAPIRKFFDTAFEGFGKGEILSTIGTLILQVLDGILALPKLLLETLAVLFGLDSVAKAIKEFSFEDKFTKVLRAILIAIGEAIPGGEWLLSKLGIKKDDGQAQGKKATPTMVMDEETRKNYDAIDTGNQQIDNLARAALESGDTELYEDLTGQGAFDVVEDTESAKELMAKKGYTADQIENIAQTGYIRGTPQAVAVPLANKAQQLDTATKELEKAKQPEPPKPPPPSIINFDARDYSKSNAHINRELHAGREGIGSKGNAGSPNIWNWKG